MGKNLERGKNPEMMVLKKRTEGNFSKACRRCDFGF